MSLGSSVRSVVKVFQKNSFWGFSTSRGVIDQTEGLNTAFTAVGTGFDVVLQRVSNIIMNVTERQNTKMLYIHCGSGLPTSLGQVRPK